MLAIRPSNEYARRMNVSVQERRQAHQPPDPLRDLSRKYAIDFGYDTPGQVTLTAIAGQNIDDALASLRQDGYTAWQSGPRSVTVNV